MRAAKEPRDKSVGLQDELGALDRLDRSLQNSDGRIFGRTGQKVVVITAMPYYPAR